MLERFFHSQFRIQALRNGHNGFLLEGFAQELDQSGYAEITARRHLRAAEHFLYWTARRGVPDGDIDDELVTHFGDHLRRCRCPGYGNAHRMDLLRGARLFFGYATGVGVGRAAEPTSQDPTLFGAFCTWMREQRGTSDQTLYNYGLSLRDLLDRVGENPRELDARSLRQFVLERSEHTGWAATKTCTTALRMFLRFLIAEGKCAAGLEGAVPVVAHWRLSSLPRYLQAEEVERVIASCDPTSSVGKRDRAILLLLARLGLRVSDVLELRLGDIDWKNAWISVSGKSKRETHLPLTQEVGQAIVDYLRDGRPQSDSDAVFLRARAPFRRFQDHCAISVIVERALRRTGVARQSRGAAHVLRHSVATSMLRQGVSLQDISAILRHSCIQTTQIYA